MKRSPIKHHRFPPEVILLAVRWHCRHPLSRRDLRDLRAERRVNARASMLDRWIVEYRATA